MLRSLTTQAILLILLQVLVSTAGYNPGNDVTEKPAKPGRQPQCNLPKDPGWFTDDYRWEYYFDAENQFCILDLYKGGGGNTNRFPTCQLCMSACDTEICVTQKSVLGGFMKADEE
uniref:Putative bpti/kunitz family of serine protease inhibitor n=1 Tax=Amblyomma americanum TaxID=6943 RepID=A0A0C9RWC6_AMBAM